MMIDLYLTSFAMGLFGSLHCAAMCGGITVAFNQATDELSRIKFSFSYQLFRIVSYAILGALAGGFGYLFSDLNFPILLVLSGIFMISLGLYLINLATPLLILERAGHRLWKKLQPIQKKLLPIRSYPQTIGVGLLWGLLPCGLVYSALAVSTSSGSPAQGFIIMLCFGMGTLPMMLSIRLVSQKVLSALRSSSLKYLVASIFIIWGSYYIYSAVANVHQHSNSLSHHGH